MLYTYFSARGVDIAAHASAPRVAHRIAYDAPSFNYRVDAERWIAEVGNPRIAAAQVLTKEINQYWEHLQAFKGDFMQPEIVLGQWLDRDHLDGCDYDRAGFYARLSASGFLDCTEWSGPFKTDREAMAYLYDTYAREDA